MNELERLLAGYRRFRTRVQQEKALYEQLGQGQTARTMVVSCSDARVDPAMIFDCGPGELFVVRNVANLVPPAETGGKYHATSAALQFAVAQLNVENIIVLGHAQCGGIRALMKGVNPGLDTEGYISEWMGLAAKARQRVLRDMAKEPEETQARACEQASILVSLENLLTFPWVRERVIEGTLRLHGWYFDIEHGEVLRYNAQARKYEGLA